MEIIRSKDGTPIAYWHSGRGDPLLLVHGTVGDHLTWTPVLTALERHFSVYTIDRRGRGHSGDADAYSLDRECEDIAAVIAAIGGTVHVLGHSFGGLCALEAALLTPNIGRLILYEPAIRLGPRDRSAAFDARMQALLEAGNPEEALLLFLRDMVKMPSQEIAAMQAMPTWGGWVAAAHLIPREVRSRDHYASIPSGFARCGLPQYSSWAVTVLHSGAPLRRPSTPHCLIARLRYSQANNTVRCARHRRYSCKKWTSCSQQPR